MNKDNNNIEIKQSTTPINSTNIGKNSFILDCLKELGFCHFLGKRNIFVRYNAGWDYTAKITLFENENGYYTRFNLELSNMADAVIKRGFVPYNKRAVRTLFDIAGEPLSLVSLKGKGWGIR